jgi:hypothetical protein
VVVAACTDNGLNKFIRQVGTLPSGGPAGFPSEGRYSHSVGGYTQPLSGPVHFPSWVCTLLFSRLEGSRWKQRWAKLLLKSNSDEALTDESSLKSNSNEPLHDDFIKK